MTNPTPVVVPPEGSRLAQLASQYAMLKPKHDELTERLKGVTDGIKAELAHERPGEQAVILSYPALDSPLKMSAKKSWRLDTKRLKSEQPIVYASYATRITSWELRAT